MLKKSRSARSAETIRLRLKEAAPGAFALRRPVAAGIFYPLEPAELKDALGRLFSASAPLAAAAGRKERVVALLVPHGAIRWAGAVMAAAYSAVRRGFGGVAVVAGPSHSGLGARFGVGTRGGWETPLGVLPIEGPLARKLLQRAPDLDRDDAGQREEHAVEVQLPFLQRLGASGFVPLSIGPCDAVTAERLGEGIARAVTECALVAAGGSGATRLGAPETLLVATANWSRYVPPDAVAGTDRAVMEAILAMDGEALLQTVAEKRLSMCGAEATAVILAAAKRLGARRAVQGGYQVHRDTAMAVSAGSFTLLG